VIMRIRYDRAPHGPTRRAAKKNQIRPERAG